MGGRQRAGSRRISAGSAGRSACETYLQHLERYFWPDLFIIGGGVSKKADKFLPHIELHTPVVAAQLLNEAGIVGAALAWTHERDRAGTRVALG